MVEDVEFTLSELLEKRKILPEVEAAAEHGLATEHSAGISGAHVVDNGDVEFTNSPKEPAATIPHHRKFQAIVKRERHLLDVGNYKTFAYTDNRRLTHTQHPFRCEDPVIAVAKAKGVVVGIHFIAVIGPRVGQLAFKMLGQMAEVEVEMLSVDREAGVERSVASFLYAAEIE